MPPRVEQTVSEALSTCESILRDLAAAQMENAGLTSQLKETTNDWVYLFEHMPIACVVTYQDGTMIEGNRSAAELLNMSTKFLENRLFTHFVQDREVFSEALRQLTAHKREVRASFAIRPRERGPVLIEAIAMPRTPGNSTAWLWFLIPHRDTPLRRKRTANDRPIEGDAGP
jgi:PAS domain-containing protein